MFRRVAVASARCARRASVAQVIAPLSASSAAIPTRFAGVAPRSAASLLAVRPLHSSQPLRDAEESEIFYPEVQAHVGSAAPEFTAPAVVDGEIKDISLSDYAGKYVILFWYPKDFTFVCPTEIIAFSDRAKEFEALDAQLIAASTDTPESHLAWIKTSRKKGGLGYVQIPVLADVTKAIAAKYGVLSYKEGIAYRGLFIINPQGVIQHVTINDFPIGRNVDEALRTLQAIRFTAEHGEVCPAGWKPGAASMVADPEKSLEYFESANDAEPEDVSPDSKVVSVKDKKAYETALAEGPVVVKYWAPWCGKCRMIAPLFEDLAADEANAALKFVSFDTTEDKLEELSAELGVKALPHFRFFRDGKEVLDGITGYKKAPLKEAVEKLRNL